MKRTVVGFMAVLAFTVSTPQASWAASEVDALIEKLVEKGVLSKNEGIELKAEVAADAHIVREDELKRMLPEWVHNTKLKGDFRARYQYERKANDTDSRDRGRYRYRLGLESKVNDQVKVGAGLASGAEDPRSTNQTFQDTFERGDVRLNYAYGEYSPSPEISIIGGVFEKKKYLWTPDDMLWDSDINPTGGAVHLERKLVGNTKGFLNSGLFVLDESTSSDKPDPFIHYVQGGTKWKNSSEKVDAT
ncbi:MAG: putative porin, partial [Candidatus Omnitrophota bacterium]|nr:putative porin [Candidatus Omnitrophota bacterium]